MFGARTIACLLAAALASSAVQALALDPPTPRNAAERSSVDSMQLGSDAMATRLDTAAKPVRPGQFALLAQASRRFGMLNDSGAHTAVLRIDRPGPAKSAGTTLAVAPGQALPPMHLRMLSGDAVTPMKLLGRYTLISTFFSACVPCIAEVPALNAYAQRHPDIRFLAVTFDDAVDAAAFVQKRGLRWPVAYAAGAWLNSAGITSFPTLILLDPRGKLVAAKTGGDETDAHPERIAQWIDSHRQAMPLSP